MYSSFSLSSAGLVFPGNDLAKKNSKRITASKGRGQPCTFQGGVVGTVTFPREEFDNRKTNMPRDTTKMYAPLGDPSCFQSMQGELAIYMLNEYGVAVRNPLAYDSQLSVTTSVNAWPYGVDGACAGVVRNARPLNQSDPAGTIAYVGTQTILNLGPLEIVAGDMVYFSLHPYADVVNGQWRNNIEIEEVGTPGADGTLNANGEYVAKFRPSTWPLRDNSVYSFIRRGQRLIDDYNPANNGNKLKGLLEKIMNPALAVYQTGDFKVADEMPILDMMRVSSVIRVLELFSIVYNKDPTNKDYLESGGFLTEIETTLEKYLVNKQENRKKYALSIGQALSSAAVASEGWRPTKRVKKISGSTNKYDGQDFGLFIVNKLFPIVKQAHLECVSEQYAYLRKRVMGKCIRGALPGAGMDVAFGYGHA
jgi:hypothetical protein